MSTHTPPAAHPPEIDYPDSDGRPMAENTLQYRWIVTIQGGIDALLRDDPEVFVAGDLLWYPLQGDNRTRVAPDVLVAFGRPKDRYRGSYMQWREGGVAPQVAFEVLSPSNDAPEMREELRFYDRHGVEEYYEYDPDRVALRGWVRRGGVLAEVLPMAGWVSPRLGIRFELGEELSIFRPDGRAFLSFREVEQRADEMRLRAEEERLRADEMQLRADEMQLRAEEERLRADGLGVRVDEERHRADELEARAEEERVRADELQRRAERLAARLRELGLEPDE